MECTPGELAIELTNNIKVEKKNGTYNKTIALSKRIERKFSQNNMVIRRACIFRT